MSEKPAPDCCDVCVPDITLCQSSTDCPSENLCENGQCLPRVNCSETDGGIDPDTQGAEEYYDQASMRFESADVCYDDTSVLEGHCYAPFAGSTETRFAEVILPCDLGCVSGACVTR